MDIENAKENIQPLASGRNIELLEVALNAETKHEAQQELLQKRQDFERQILQYEGDDPLELWFEYILWIEQCYPKSGKESAFEEVLIKCISTFETDEKYNQDRRMIKLYIKYIDLQSNPQEHYQALYSQGIGTMIADLYICWAYYFEVIENFHRAEEIFRMGIDARAQPLEELKQAHIQFGFSMSQRLLYRDESSRKDFLTTMEEKRFALTSLRGHRSKKTVGSRRTGHVVKDINPGRIEQTTKETMKVGLYPLAPTNIKVDVYQDDEPQGAAGISPDSRTQNEPQSVIKSIVDSSRKQENDREPSIWSKAKLTSQHGPLFPNPTSNPECSLGFAILEDSQDRGEILDCGNIKLPPNFCCKNKPQPIWKVPIFIKEDIIPMTVPLYDKIFQYPKGIEDCFSPDELRGYYWFKRRNIKNNYLIGRMNAFVEIEPESGIRLPINFVKTNIKQDEYFAEKCLLDLGQGKYLQCKYGDMNLTSEMGEISFEELYKIKYQNKKNEESIKENIEESPVKLIEEIAHVSEEDKFADPIAVSESVPSNAADNITEKVNLNDSCSTQTFNFFIKAQSISTPKFGKKSISIPRPSMPFQAHTSKEVSPPANDKDGFLVPAITPPSQDRQISGNFTTPMAPVVVTQLSTIMETTEGNTNSSASAASTKSSVDTQACLQEHVDTLESRTINLTQTVPEISKLITNAKKDDKIDVNKTVPPVQLEEIPSLCPIPIYEDPTETFKMVLKLTISPPSEEPEAAAAAVVKEDLESVIMKKADNEHHELFDIFTKTPEKRAIKMNHSSVLSTTRKDDWRFKHNFGHRIVDQEKNDNFRLPNLLANDSLLTLPSMKEFTINSMTKVDDQQNNESITAPIIKEMMISSRLDKSTGAIKKDKSLLMMPNQKHNEIPNESLTFNSLVNMKSEPEKPKIANISSLNHNLSVFSHLRKDTDVNLLDKMSKDSSISMLSVKDRTSFFIQNDSMKPETGTIKKTPITDEVSALKQNESITFPHMMMMNEAATSTRNDFNSFLKLEGDLNKENQSTKNSTKHHLEISPRIIQITNAARHSFELVKSSPIYPSPPHSNQRQAHQKSTNCPMELNFDNNLSPLLEETTKSIETTKVMMQMIDEAPMSTRNDFNNFTKSEASIKKEKCEKSHTDLLMVPDNDSRFKRKSHLSSKIPIFSKIETLPKVEPTDNIVEPDVDNKASIEKIPEKENLPADGITSARGSSINYNISITYNEYELQNFLDKNHDKTVVVDLIETDGTDINSKNDDQNNEENVFGPHHSVINEKWFDDNDDGDDGIIEPVAAYVQKEINLDETQHIINELLISKSMNPFDLVLTNALLENINFCNYLENLESCEMMKKIPFLKCGSVINIKDEMFTVTNLIGAGAYGKVFSAKNSKNGKVYAVKQERPANLWEYYICLELKSRLCNDEFMKNFMDVQYALIGNNASILVTPYCEYGNLVNVCNNVKLLTSKNLDEYIVMMFAAQILTIIDHLHSCNIIHADIKPDNFMLMSKLNYDDATPVLKLIDFGQSIDMDILPEGTTFKYVITTKGFTCTEMLDNKPWTFQTDLFCTAATIHALLFNRYLEVTRHLNRWRMKTNLPRYFNKTIWETIFSTLLNVRDCKNLPNLQNLTLSLKEEIAAKESYVRNQIIKFNNVLINK